LFQLVEGSDAAIHHFARINRRGDATRAALKQLNTERSLQIGDHAGDRRLGDAELCRGASHAAPLRNREKYVQVPQSNAAPDLMFAIEFFSHSKKLPASACIFNRKVHAL
jgi:hypothetical protein